MDNALDVRPYHIKDLDQLMDAWEGANALAHPFLSEAYVAQLRRDIPALYLPNADTWVADLDGRVVGFLALIGNEVGAIFLQPDFHARGIGRALMDKAQELHGELEVEVFKENSIGREFYDNYGFVLLEEKCHEPTGDQVLRLSFTPTK